MGLGLLQLGELDTRSGGATQCAWLRRGLRSKTRCRRTLAPGEVREEGGGRLALRGRRRKLARLRPALAARGRTAAACRRAHHATATTLVAPPGRTHTRLTR